MVFYLTEHIDLYLFLIPLLAGFVLDSLLGDPYWLPHPVRFFGFLISKGENVLNNGGNRVLKGMLLSIFLFLAIFFLFYIIHLLFLNKGLLYCILASFVVYFGIANLALIKEGLKVDKVLRKEGLESGRRQLSYIVGRETDKLDENQIRRAVLETMSENLSDGVIAPLFYFFIGGFPLLMAYKMLNTLDSMIAYKSEKYRQFGFFAAKLDDIFNYIPARLTAIIMVIITFSNRGLRYVFLYGNKHSSPNAGIPEAALAGILDCRFGGPNHYHGELVDKPFIGKNNRQVNSADILKTAFLNFFSSLVFIILLLFLSHIILP